MIRLNASGRRLMLISKYRQQEDFSHLIEGVICEAQADKRSHDGFVSSRLQIVCRWVDNSTNSGVCFFVPGVGQDRANDLETHVGFACAWRACASHLR